MMNGVGQDTESSDLRVRLCGCASISLLCICLTVVLGTCASTALAQIPEVGAQADTRSTAEPLTAIIIEGARRTIPDDAILEHIKSQLGRPISEQQVKEDVRALFATRWFYSVEPRRRMTQKGVALVFVVVERPILKSVEFRGNEHIKTKYLVDLTGLKTGGAFDVSANRESARRIETHYRDKGYPFAKVELIKGDSPDDRDVIFEIDEGKKVIVTKFKFTGNEFFSNALLKTRLKTPKAILGFSFLGGKYDPSTIPDDIASLRNYYESLGFFDVQIDHRVAISDAPISKHVSHVTIEYIIDEGMQFQVGEIELIGNEIFSSEEIKQSFQLAPGDHFNARKLNADIDGLQERYGELGRLFARVEVDRRFLATPGVVGLIYRIHEDKPQKIRRVNVHILGDNPHTKESVVLNRVLTHPGDLANPIDIKRSERRLESQLFERGPSNGPRVQISRVEMPDPQLPTSVVRGQNIDPLVPQAPNPIFENNNQGDPFARALREPLGYVDLDYYATEARTGRLMFGVGVNSNAGVVGSIVLEENNFDILRPPTSFQDFADGTAWRGAGQRFRLEAIPGNVVSRYLMSWSDPYFLDTDYSLGVSGFYFNRFYPNWDEDRLGGRVSVGRQLTREFSLTGALRLESVELRNPDTPTPDILQESIGQSFLSTARVSAAHDTRDVPFLPAEGHFIELSAEQAFGDYMYPRFDAEARQYFTLYKRPDDGGRHILSLSAQVAWTDSDTPIFERYYAGGFQSFRGFAFRGVSPSELGIRVGGRWMFLGGAEYQAPITADENIKAVAFTDFGTVENSVGLNDFRVSVGAGLRLTIPAMGSAPIALDWAIPIIKQDFDDTQIFSFYVGITR